MRVDYLCVGLPAAGLLALGALALGAPQFSRQDNQYVLRGTPLELTWAADTGALLRVRHAKTDLDLLAGAQKPFDLHTEAGWAFSATTARAARLGALVLDGEWDFRLEGGKWGKLRVPGAWEDQGVTQVTPQDPNPDWQPYNGTGYYKRTFDLPAALRGRDLVLALQRVDDFDWVTVNGREVGHTGQETKEWWATPRRYTVPAAALKPAGNTIEVKIYDRGGEGGILGSVMLMAAEQAAALERPPLKLAAADMKLRGTVAEVTLQYEGEGWHATEVYDVAAEGPGYFARRAELQPGKAAGRAKFDASELYLGRAAERLARVGRIAVPYSWPPLNQALKQFAQGGDVNQYCGSAVTGVGIYSETPALAFAIGQYWEQDWNRFVCRGRDGTVTFVSNYGTVGRLRPGLRIPLGGQFLLVAEGTDRSAALQAVGRGWQRLGFHRPSCPQWAESIALYSCHPNGTIGSGFRDLRSAGDGPTPLQNFQRLQLPIIKRLGINAIWFLPLWPRLYGVSDYWSLDPAIGSVEDLRAVVKQAHGGGIRVLCDLIPHGPHESSGLAREHPEFVSRHEDGSILYWWGCLCCDYAHPGWQEYMAQVATHWAREADIDGWRVDCASGAPANWKPYGDNLPSWSGQWGGLRHMERVREEMAKVKPEHVLLAEAANPPMLSQAHFIYDWPTETALFDVLKRPRAQWVRDMRDWLDYQRLALPPGAAHGLMRFTENHDQLHSVWQLGPDLARPVWALMTLAEGFPLLYHEQEVGFEDFWARILHLRRAVPELHRGQADYGALVCDQPEVLAFVRRDTERASIVAINFSHEARSCNITWPGAPTGLEQARELPSGAWLRPNRRAGELVFTIRIPAYDWRVAVLRSGREELETLPLSPGLEPLAAEPKPARWEGLRAKVILRAGGQERTETIGPGGLKSIGPTAGELEGATIEAKGGWKLAWRSGLLAGLALGEAKLADGMWVWEGKNQVSWDKPLGFGERLSGAAPPSVPERTGVKPTHWQVAVADQGLTLEYQGAGEDFALSSRYLVRADAVVEAEVKLTPKQETEPVIGQLSLALGCPQADRWLVRGFEGELGGPFFVRHPTAREYGGRFWHPLQRLWQHSVQPLSLQLPALGWQVSGHWLWLEMADYP